MSKTTNGKQPTLLQKIWQHKLYRWLLGITGGLAILVIGVYIAFQVSPWPQSLVIRYFFNKGGAKSSAAMAKYVPDTISGQTNLQYREHDKDAKLDVFYPDSVAHTNKVLPTIVWVHGGGWVSGSKETIDNYIKILAAKGYTTIGINYTVAPNAKYPTPILQTNDALRYVQKHADQLHVDPNTIILAGDSAGSQIAAQVATIITNSFYAHKLGMTAPMRADQLKAMVLNCGAYDLTLPNYSGEDGKFLKTVLWAYSGSKDFLSDPVIKGASVVDYVNANFPPSFITAGNIDPLESQSREFAGRLTQLGVSTDTLFYPENHQPELPHEYQFDLDSKDGKTALNRIIAFLQQYAQ
jgi:acetyl esterase/lipase